MKKVMILLLACFCFPQLAISQIERAPAREGSKTVAPSAKISSAKIKSAKVSQARALCATFRGRQQRQCLATLQKYLNQQRSRTAPRAAAATDKVASSPYKYTCSRTHCYCHDHHLFNATDCWAMWLTKCTGPLEHAPGSGGVVKCRSD